jgi:hypothetical protein
MDSIDVTDSAFSLNAPEVSDLISNGDSANDYTIYIYAVIASLILFIFLFVFKYYQSKSIPQNEELDCTGGFCSMNQHI